MQVLATIAPLDPATGSRVTLRASSADRREMLALNSVRWVPAIIRRPSISDDLFDGNFTGAINDGGATIDLAMFGLKRQDSLAAKYRYAGAAVTIYHGEIGDAWPWDVAFTGIVDSFTNDAERLSLRLKVNTAPFGVPVLTATYAGTGGKEGGADLKFKVKPWCFGAASNVQPVLIDVTNSVYQVSAYGPINGVTACYERGASFGASYGNYTTYANLVAASIPPGRWATCLAEGMIRLGAPETGLITADVEGDKPSTFLRKTGEIIDRICTNAGIASGSIDSTSLNGLDTALTTLLTGDGYINLYLTEQTTVMEIAQRLARPCNAAAGVHPRTGKLYVCRTAAIGTSVLSLNAQGRKIPSEPGVLACVEQDVSPPYWRIEMQGQRSWRVHSASEIAFTADLVEVGDYAGGTTYREGNIVTDQGGRWLYINPTAAAGNAPPTLPTTSNSYWSSLALPVDYTEVAGTKPPSNADNTAASQVVVTVPALVEYDANYLGAIPGTTANLVSNESIRVSRGGVSIKTDNSVTYAITINGGISGAVIDNTTGSGTKGDISGITFTGNTASIDCVVTVSGVAQPRVTINFAKRLAAPPAPGGGSNPKLKSTSGFALGTGATSYTVLVAPMTVTIATGESLYATAPLDYEISGTTTASRTCTAKWQYSVAGANSWSDFPSSPISGSAAYSDYYINSSEGWAGASQGYIAMTQTKPTPGVGDWDVRVIGYQSASGRTMTFYGTATIEAKV